MYRRTAALLILIPLTSMLWGCGGKKLCEERNPASFATFLDEDWRAYCETYRVHTQAPANFTMLELTEFFGNHPGKVKELTKSLYEFNNYETCFKSPKEELELRALQTCLQDNDQADIEVTNAWSTLAEPWVADLRLGVQELTPRFSDAEREASRQERKISDAFEFNKPLEVQEFESLQVELQSLDKAMTPLEDAAREYTALMKRAQGHGALVNLMENDFRPQINAITADVASLRTRHTALAKEVRYLEFAASSAGIPCPKTLRGATAEQRIANSVAKGRNNEVAGSGPRILTKTRADSSGDNEFERFEGFICGIRGAETQFDGKPQLCAQHRFVIERQRPSGAQKWGDWSLKSFEEAGSNGGVDCALKNK